MLNKQIIALCTALCCAVVPVMSQTPEKSQQDAKKEKGWSGFQMPSWVFLFIGAFIR